MKFEIGDTVYLNDEGIKNINGLKTWEEVSQAKRLVITKIGRESLTTDIPLFEIEVDNLLINQYVLTTKDITLGAML